MLTLIVCSLALLAIFLLASAEKSPPRKALPPPCEVQCLEAKLAASEKKSVRRLKLLSAREHRIVRLLVALRRREHIGTPVRTDRQPGGVRGVICSVFGAHCSEAQRVAWCESRFNVRATNGDYWGLFQFGSFARAHYGFAWDALTQSRAAYRYFLDAGWSPWTCKP